MMIDLTAKQPIAVIDLGSNSAQLMLGSYDGVHLEIIDQHKVPLRLGEALGKDSRFDEKTILKTVLAMKQIASIAKVHQPVYRAVATHACRLAKNHATLFHRIKDQTGIEVELIDGREEARLASLGMLKGLALEHKSFFGVDCGGGSTEMALIDKSRPDFLTSMDLGCVILSKRFLWPKVSDEHIKLMYEHIRDKLWCLEDDLKRLNFSLAIGSSSIAKTLANIYGSKYKSLGELFDLHGFVFPSSGLFEIEKKLFELKTKDKIAKTFDLEPQKADIILAGTAILSEISRFLGIKNWTISTYGLREGVLFDTISRIKEAQNHSNFEQTDSLDIRSSSIERLGTKFAIDGGYAKRVTEFSLKIYDEIFKYLDLVETPGQMPARELLKAAAYLHECGKFLSFPKFHLHSYYLITRSYMLGFSQHERQLIGLIAKYHRKSKASIKKLDCEELSAGEVKKVNILAGILRLVTNLHRTRRHTIQSVELRAKGADPKIISLHVFCNSSECPATDLAKAEASKDYLEKYLGRSIKITRYTNK